MRLRALIAALVAVGLMLAGCGTSSNRGRNRPSNAAGASTVVTSAPSTGAASTSPSTGPSTGSAPAPAVRSLAGFRVVDLTFVGTADGWALGTAPCGTGRCAVIASTGDGGRTWRPVPAPAAHAASDVASCTQPCIAHLRFATDRIGYAFGQSVLYLTTNGGRTWTRQPGGALALESLDGDVIRASSMCLPGCPITVQTAPVGSSAWHTVARAGNPTATSAGAGLARTGGAAYLAVYGNPAGGGPATTAVWASTDDGASWRELGEPCPQHLAGYGEVDTTQLTTAPDGAVVVLCTPRQHGQAWQFTMTSTDGGHSFARGDIRALGNVPAGALAAASALVQLVSLGDDTYRTVDGGKHFARLGVNSGADPGPADWLGFETASVGRAVAAGGASIWTTRDAGASWTRATFG